MDKTIRSDITRAGLEARLHDKGGTITYKPRPKMLRATHVSDDKIEIVPRNHGQDRLVPVDNQAENKPKRIL